MEYYTGYREDELKHVIEHINQSYQQILVSKYKNIILKFDTKEYKYCSSTVFAISNSQLRYDRIKNDDINKIKSIENNNNNNHNKDNKDNSNKKKNYIFDFQSENTKKQKECQNGQRTSK